MKFAPAHVLLLGLLPACLQGSGDASWVPVERGDLILSVEVTGSLRSVNSTPVKPPPTDQWDSKISAMAPEGADVQPGDMVVAFDVSEMMRELQEMQNEADAAAKEISKKQADSAMARKDQALAIAEADAVLRKALLKSERPADLAAAVDLKLADIDRKIAEMDLRNAKAVEAQGRRSDASILKRLEGNLASYQRRVKQIQDNIARMQVVADRAGTIIYPTNWRGEKKKVGDSVWRMESVVEIAALDEMEGAGEVDEADSSRVAVGQRVSLRLDAHPDVEIIGVVSSLADVVQQQSRSNPSRVVKLDIAIEEAGDVPLRPGMRFRGQIETGRIPDVVMVPAEAVFVTEEGAFAFRKSSDDWEKVRLEVGKRNPSKIEVTSGLSLGDQVAREDLERSR